MDYLICTIEMDDVLCTAVTYMLCSVNTALTNTHTHKSLNINILTNTHNQTDLRDEGTLVSLPYRQPHKCISQLFHLLVVIQPFDLSL